MFYVRTTVLCCYGYLPTMLQQIYGYPVDLAGYITAPRGVAAIY